MYTHGMSEYIRLANQAGWTTDIMGDRGYVGRLAQLVERTLCT